MKGLHPKDIYKKGTPFIVNLCKEDYKPGETYAVARLLKKWKRRQLKEKRKKRRTADRDQLHQSLSVTNLGEVDRKLNEQREVVEDEGKDNDDEQDEIPVLWLTFAKQADGFVFLQVEKAATIQTSTLLFPIEDSQGTFLEMEKEEYLVMLKTVEQDISQRAREVIDRLAKEEGVGVGETTWRSQGKEKQMENEQENEGEREREKKKNEAKDDLMMIEAIVAKKKPKANAPSRFLVRWKPEKKKKPSWEVAGRLPPSWQLICKGRDWKKLNDAFISSSGEGNLSKTLLAALRRACPKINGRGGKRNSTPRRNNSNTRKNGETNGRGQSSRRVNGQYLEDDIIIYDSDEQETPKKVVHSEAYIAGMQQVMKPRLYPSPSSERHLSALPRQLFPPLSATPLSFCEEEEGSTSFTPLTFCDGDAAMGFFNSRHSIDVDPFASLPLAPPPSQQQGQHTRSPLYPTPTAMLFQPLDTDEPIDLDKRPPQQQKQQQQHHQQHQVSQVSLMNAMQSYIRVVFGDESSMVLTCMTPVNDIIEVGLKMLMKKPKDGEEWMLCDAEGKEYRPQEVMTPEIVEAAGGVFLLMDTRMMDESFLEEEEEKKKGEEDAKMLENVEEQDEELRRQKEEHQDEVEEVVSVEKMPATSPRKGETVQLFIGEEEQKAEQTEGLGKNLEEEYIEELMLEAAMVEEEEEEDEEEGKGQGEEKGKEKVKGDEEEGEEQEGEEEEEEQEGEGEEEEEKQQPDTQRQKMEWSAAEVQWFGPSPQEIEALEKEQEELCRAAANIEEEEDEDDEDKEEEVEDEEEIKDEEEEEDKEEVKDEEEVKDKAEVEDEEDEDVSDSDISFMFIE